MEARSYPIILLLAFLLSMPSLNAQTPGTAAVKAETEAENDKGTAVLRWSADWIEHFTVELLKDGVYQRVGDAPGSAEGGLRHYEFRIMDTRKSLTGKFRVRATGDDSVNRTVTLATTASAGTPFPNPFRGTLNLPLSGTHRDKVEITVTNLSGNIIATMAEGTISKTTGNVGQWIPHDAVPTGVYLVRITSGATQESYRVHYVK